MRRTEHWREWRKCVVERWQGLFLHYPFNRFSKSRSRQLGLGSRFRFTIIIAHLKAHGTASQRSLCTTTRFWWAGSSIPSWVHQLQVQLSKLCRGASEIGVDFVGFLLFKHLTKIPLFGEKLGHHPTSIQLDLKSWNYQCCAAVCFCYVWQLSKLAMVADRLVAYLTHYHL